MAFTLEELRNEKAHTGIELNTEIVTAKDIVGTYLEAYVRVVKMRFPKCSYDQMEDFCRGILVVEIEEVINGELPFELTQNSNAFRPVTFVVKGLIPRINPFKTYHMIGKLVIDKDWGPQYELEDFSSEVNLDSPAEFQHFLEATIGESKTKLLTDWFTNPLEVLQEGDIDKLVAVKGLGEDSARKLLEKFQEEAQNGLAYAKLAPYGLTKNQAKKVVSAFGSLDAALIRLEKNPYCLMDIVDGYGWKKTDEIALNVGIDPCGEFRLRAYTRWLLQENADNQGHSWMTVAYIATALHSIALNLEDKDLLPMMQKWIDEDNPDSFLFCDRATQRIGLKKLYVQEDLIASHLLRLHHSDTKVYSDEEIESAIQECEVEVGFTYTSEQRDAIYSCLRNNVSIVVGSAGVGKSSIMRPITKLLKNKGENFEQCSLSGKAASNLAEMTGATGSTIHKLLHFNPETNSFTKNEFDPLETDLVILDEISLVGVDIFLKLLRAIPDGCKLIMLGDSKQLESIGVGNLIKDIPLSGAVNAKTLVQIHRQAAKSGIITESMRVSAGEKLCGQYAINERRGELQDLKVITYTELALTATTVLEEYRALWEKGIPIKDMMVILPMKEKGDASVLYINRAIQEMVNGIPQEEDIDIKKGNMAYTLRPGDKIIIKKNNYDAMKKLSTKDNGIDIVAKEAIFNGNVGFFIGTDTIVKENKDRSRNEIPCAIVDLTIQGRIYIPLEDINCVELGYAMTCHSAQGSGCPYVIVGLDMRCYALLSKEWVYTALTRAKKECILVSQINALRRASEISRVSTKHTWLQELLVRKEQEFQTTGKLPEIKKTNIDEGDEAIHEG